jgi:hypothetical protein
MEHFRLWVAWLKIVGFGLVIFGIIMTFFNATALFGMFNKGIDPVFWGSTISDTRAISFRTWVYGAWGATIAGWGISLLFIVYNAFTRQERWAWFAISGGLVVWYLLDTGMSAYFGVGFNVIFNSLIMGLVAIPLVGSYSVFKK